MIPWKFSRNSSELVPNLRIFWGIKVFRLSLKNSWEFLRNFRRNIQEICLGNILENSQEFPEKYSRKFLRNFLGKIPEKISGISRNLFSKLWSLKNLSNWGPYSGEFHKNFRGISHMNLFSRNSPEIPKSKSPKLENLEKFLTFVTWVIWTISNYLKVIWTISFKVLKFCFVQIQTAHMPISKL